jgi:quercetin dioxygenase-like cupin family protein
LAADIPIGRSAGQSILFATLLVAAITAATSAFTGECPAGKMQANVRPPVNTPASGVTGTTLGLIDLSKEPVMLKDHELRFRKLTITPGGVVPWHSHADRPALIFVAQGEIVEYASNCSEPIVHKAGDIRSETSGTSHWWKNLGDQTVILYVGDVLHDKNDHNM